SRPGLASEARTSAFSWPMNVLIAISVYMAAQFGIGLWVSRRIRTESDFLLAGRSLGYTLLTFSTFATWFGAETIVGSSGRAYADGISLGSAEPFAYGLCLVIMGLVFAVPLWTRQLTTLADLYRDRYSVATERIAAVILIPSSIIWAAAQTRALSYVLTSSHGGIDGEVAIAIAAGVTILYSMFGGMLVDAITDVLQGAILAVGLVVVLFALLPHLGGAGAVASAMADPARVHWVPHGENTLTLLERWAIPVGGSVLATELVGRVLAAKSAAVARSSTLTAAAAYVVIGSIPLVIGLAGPHVVPNLANEEQLLPQLSRTVLPGVLYPVFAGALIAAILSTVNSTLLVSSGILSHNLLVPILGVADDRRRLLLARGSVMAFGIIAYVLARRAEGILELVEQASAMGSAGALVTAVFALFTKFGGPRAAIATLLTGLGVYLGATVADATTPFLLALVASVGVYLAVGALERKPLSRA
ncbi:MAG: sodium:solute symporter family protein, partial [Longimicrobiales bacterium]